MAEEGVNHAEPQTIGQKVAAQGALEVQESLKAALQLVRCVSQLHTEGRIHRRICADTVLYDEAMLITLKPAESVVMIGGIGVDQVPCPPQFHQVPPFSLPMETEAAKEALTQNGLLLDPHQLDYYQIGALLCFMASALDVADYLRSCKAKAQVPQVVRPVIDRALGLNSKECFDSAEAFAAAIEAALSGAPVAADNSPETAGEALPFETLGHYEIIELIGHGGMGDVYKGYEKNLDRFVALKVLPAELGRHKDFVKRFHAEAASLAKIDHPNIVRIFYSGQDQGRHFFAMQYIEGQSLAEVLGREQKLSIAEALPIVRQCLAGLSAVHQHGLVHRDIKPGNVLLERATDRALVTDFGVAKTLYGGTQMTVTGTIMGTADYIAPEQARGGEVDGRADLYSVGVLMYQMLSGKLPFEAKSATSMMFQHAYEPPLPLSEAAPDVPAHIVGIVMKLMAKEPDRRFQTAEEVLAALSSEDFSASLPYPSPQTADMKSSSFDWTPPPPLSGFVAKGGAIRNRLIGLRNRIWGFLGFVAPHLAESMQTTCQQVDGAVEDYQRRRDTLAACAKEAQAMAVDLQMKAAAARNAASAAGRRLQTAVDTAAKQQALKEKEESEHAAAELAQLAAEQKQQADEIDLRLATVNATLNRLCTQRDALNARLKLANARNKAEGAAPEKRWPKRQFAYALLIALLVGFLIYVFHPRNSLIAHWKFNEGRGNIAYDSAGSNDGTIHGGTWINSKNITALQFDGFADYVEIPDSAILDISEKKLTVSAWINPDRIDKRQVIIAKNAYNANSWILEINPVDYQNGTINFFIDAFGNKGNFGSHTTINVKQWSHIVGVFDGNERKIYINGQLDAIQSISGRIATTAEPVRIGGGGNMTRYFKGLINDVSIYNTALSDQNIQRLYQSGLYHLSSSNHSQQSPAVLIDNSTIVDKTFKLESNPQVLGKWVTIDFVRHIEDFKPNQRQWRDDLYLKGLTFLRTAPPPARGTGKTGPCTIRAIILMPNASSKFSTGRRICLWNG